MKINDYGAQPQTEEELADYLRDLVDAQHDYNSSAQALHDGAMAAFNYLAHRLGNSGFQASHAALRLLGTVNGYGGPYGLLKAEDALFPQYPSAQERAQEMADGWRDWLADEARRRLAENPEVVYRTVTDEDGNDPVQVPNVSPAVHEHWRALAAYAREQGEGGR